MQQKQITRFSRFSQSFEATGVAAVAEGCRKFLVPQTIQHMALVSNVPRFSCETVRTHGKSILLVHP